MKLKYSKKSVHRLISKTNCVNTRDIFWIVTIYSLAYGVILLNDGIFWDDWVFYKAAKPIETLLTIGSEVGQPWIGYILLLSSSPIVYRIMVFCCYLFAALFLYKTLKTVSEMGDKERFFITLFFALFPVNFNRIALCVSYRSLFYMFFFLGLFLLSKYLNTRKIFIRILSLLFFFISFSTIPSLLVLYGIVILFILYKEFANFKTIKSSLLVFLRYIDFIIIPIIWQIIKNIFFNPHGLYAGLYEVSLDMLFVSPHSFNSAFYASFIGPLQSAFYLAFSEPLVTIIFTLLVGVFICKMYSSQRDDVCVKDFFWLLFGVVAFVLGVYAYLVVGHMPQLAEWQSRHQILVPLGASFVIVYFARIFFNFNARILMYSMLSVLFVYINFTGYLEYQRDWFKQLSLVENLMSNDVIRNHNTFLFDDSTTDLNARGRTYRLYEISGMMKLAFGDEKRFGVMKGSYLGIDAYKFYPGSRYKMREYDFLNMNKPEYMIKIGRGENTNNLLSKTFVLKLLLERIFFPKRFNENLKSIVNLETIKL